MSDIDHTKRQLIRAAGIVGAACAASVGYPLLNALLPVPSRVRDSTLSIDLSTVAPGTLVTHPWQGYPLWILHRTVAMIDQLSSINNDLLDPDSHISDTPSYCRNVYRSRHPAFFVAIGLCTHLGCIPVLSKKAYEFLCPCHGSRYDLAGRVLKGMPAITNLSIPPHTIEDHLLTVGHE